MESSAVGRIKGNATINLLNEVDMSQYRLLREKFVELHRQYAPADGASSGKSF